MFHIKSLHKKISWNQRNLNVSSSFLNEMKTTSFLSLLLISIRLVKGLSCHSLTTLVVAPGLNRHPTSTVALKERNEVTGSFHHKPSSFTEMACASVRGGSKQSLTSLKTSEKSTEGSRTKYSLTKKTASIALVTSLATAIFMNRQAIAAFNFKQELSNALDYLADLGTPGLIIYTIAFTLWEIVVGVTTPVETAAGMAFGLRNGIISNAIGKTTGAISSFLLGRYVLKDYVEKKLEGNEYMDLVQDSIVKNPLRVSLIWRFSFFPEQVKCCGLAVLPVKLWQYIAAVLIHGFPFTLLWTFLGNEMGAIVRGTASQPSKTLKLLIGGVYVFGFFISPSLVGMWIKGLRDAKLEKDSKNKK